MTKVNANQDTEQFRKELKLRHRLKTDFLFYAPTALKIRPKGGKIEPFEINKAQKYLHYVAEKQRAEKGYIRIMVLKGRQQGISTYIEGRFYWKTSHSKGINAFILTHEDKATTNLFQMAKRYHDHCLPMVKPETKSQSGKELSFSSLDSGYSVGTAGTKAVGRSGTVQLFHGSEVAFWPHADTHATGVMQSIPMVDDTEVFLESTGNGVGNYFHAQWQLAERGESDYIAVFLPWYWQDEYTRELDDEFELTPDELKLLDQFGDDGLTQEHLHWRRYKIMEFTAGGDDGEWKFKQEYPFTATEAFQTSGEEALIDTKSVLAARKTEKSMTGPHVVGVDPARFGSDRTAIIHRNGRKAYGLKTYKKKSTMEVAGICSRILRDPVTGQASDVAMMFIDVIGIGAGVYDRLAELGFEEEGRIMAVSSSNTAIENDKYTNKRTEMWVNMRNWFQQPGGVDIPDDDVIQSDVCTPRYTYDSAGRYVLESKDKIKARGLLSPDSGDALAMTFAEPVAPMDLKKIQQMKSVQTISYEV